MAKEEKRKKKERFSLVAQNRPRMWTVHGEQIEAGMSNEKIPFAWCTNERRPGINRGIFFGKVIFTKTGRSLPYKPGPTTDVYAYTNLYLTVHTHKYAETIVHATVRFRLRTPSVCTRNTHQRSGLATSNTCNQQRPGRNICINAMAYRDAYHRRDLMVLS